MNQAVLDKFDEFGERYNIIATDIEALLKDVGTLKKQHQLDASYRKQADKTFAQLKAVEDNSNNIEYHDVLIKVLEGQYGDHQKVLDSLAKSLGQHDLQMKELAIKLAAASTPVPTAQPVPEPSITDLAESLLIRLARGEELPQSTTGVLYKALQPAAPLAKNKRKADEASLSLATPATDGQTNSSGSRSSDGSEPLLKRPRSRPPKNPPYTAMQWKQRHGSETSNSAVQSGADITSVDSTMVDSTNGGDKAARRTTNAAAATATTPAKRRGRPPGRVSALHDESDGEEDYEPSQQTPRRSGRKQKKTERGKEFMSWFDVKQQGVSVGSD